MDEDQLPGENRSWASEYFPHEGITRAYNKPKKNSCYTWHLSLTKTTKATNLPQFFTDLHYLLIAMHLKSQGLWAFRTLSRRLRNNRKHILHINILISVYCVTVDVISVQTTWRAQRSAWRTDGKRQDAAASPSFAPFWSCSMWYFG